MGDVTVTLMWDNYCDLDLHAICPDRTHISCMYKIWKVGGLIRGNLDADMNVDGESKEPIENIFFGDLEKNIVAPKGKYLIFVWNFNYHGDTTSGDVPW